MKWQRKTWACRKVSVCCDVLSGATQPAVDGVQGRMQGMDPPCASPGEFTIIPGTEFSPFG